MISTDAESLQVPAFVLLDWLTVRKEEEVCIDGMCPGHLLCVLHPSNLHLHLCSKCASSFTVYGLRLSALLFPWSFYMHSLVLQH